MVLKAAVFSFRGFSTAAVLGWATEIRPQIQHGRDVLGIAWPRAGEGHNVRAWAELLVAIRASNPATAFPVAFGLEVQRRGQKVEELWRETLRYRKNFAYLYEVAQVREAAEWFLANTARL